MNVEARAVIFWKACKSTNPRIHFRQLQLAMVPERPSPQSRTMARMAASFNRTSSPLGATWRGCCRDPDPRLLPCLSSILRRLWLFCQECGARRRPRRSGNARRTGHSGAGDRQGGSRALANPGPTWTTNFSAAGPAVNGRCSVAQQAPVLPRYAELGRCARADSAP